MENTTSKSNTEVLTELIRDAILPRGFDIDKAILLPDHSDAFVFYDAEVDKILEVRISPSLQFQTYKFGNGHRCCFKTTQRERRFLAVDWTSNELKILYHLLDKYGLTNYFVREVYYKPDTDSCYSNFHFYEVIFAEDADAAAFALYFSNFFVPHCEEDEILKVIKKNKMLE